MTTAAPRFAVIKHCPHYDDRDCIAFWTLRKVADVLTKAWAFKLAEVQSYDGEYRVDVVDLATGERIHREWAEDGFTPLPF